SGFQWFAIDFDGDRVSGRQRGLEAAAPVLVQFLQDAWAQTGLGAKDTIVAGFSQGAMMALHAGLSLPEPLMGVIAFSGAFVPPPGFGEAGLPKPPVCIVHGDMDQVVDPALGDEANTVLVAAGYDVRYHVSRGVGHGISPDGLGFASDFIAAVSAPK
ncbi:MAG: hypothetical protein JWQ65_2570, partial [Devosia sp.]|nr:hypothetical protein [Devosia sp.]